MRARFKPLVDDRSRALMDATAAELKVGAAHVDSP
jgi:hypothetical protein